MRLSLFILRLAISTMGLASFVCYGADQPQWGKAWTRNQVSTETGLPGTFDPATGANIKWQADIGTQTHSTPVVANGRVFIGTNNGNPKDPKHQGDRGVLMCFSEKDGHLLWQLVTQKRSEDKYFDWPNQGCSSPVTVEGDRVYFVTNRHEVVCLDINGMANGNDGPFKDEGQYLAGEGRPPMEPGPLDADIIWVFDMVKDAGIWPHDGAHSSILIDGSRLYLNTGNGVDNTHRVIRKQDAPSLIVMDKATGRWLARDDEHIAPRIFHATWSSPSLVEIEGRRRLFFCGGDGVVYGFDPLTADPPPGKVLNMNAVWKFDIDPTGPKENVHQFTTNRMEGPSSIFGMPVVENGKLFVAGGGDTWWGKTHCWLKCINPAGQSDVTSTNQVWSLDLVKHVMSTPAIANGLIYIADLGGNLYCVDEKSGQTVWTQDIEGDAWASPYVADGKVYLGTRKGMFYVLAAGREKKLLMSQKLNAPISSTTVAANGVIYVATMKTLYTLALKPAGS